MSNARIKERLQIYEMVGSRDNNDRNNVGETQITYRENSQIRQYKQDEKQADWERLRAD